MRAQVEPGPGARTAAGAVRAVHAGHVRARDIAAESEQRCREAVGDAVVTPLDPVAEKLDEAPVDPVEARALAGVTVGIKDLMAVAGAPTTLGLPVLGEAMPARSDAEIVRRLRAAGASIPATLALHPLAFGVTGEGVRNPSAPDRLPGGSSSGSAAAVAAGLVHAATGTDTGGSVRIPAACCGVVGMKPTFGAVSTRGVQPLAWSLDTVGLLAATVADVQLLWPQIAGYDPDDPASEPYPVAAPADPPAVVGRPSGLVPQGMHPEVARVWEGVLAQLEQAGVRVVEVDLPSLGAAHAANGDVLCVEAAAVWEQAFTRDPDVFGENLGRRFRYGLALRAVDAARARQVATRMRAELRAARRVADVLLLPSLPCRAPRPRDRQVDVGADHPVPVTPALTRYTNAWNLCGAPAGSVPGGRDADGAPVGIQLVGGLGEDARVLAAMELVEGLDAVDV